MQVSAWNNPTYDLVDTGRHGADYVPVDNKVQTSAMATPQTNLTNVERGNGIDAQSYTDYKVKSSAQAPANYKLVGNQGPDISIRTVNKVAASHNSTPSRNIEVGERGRCDLDTPLQAGSYTGRAGVPTIQAHPEYTRTKQSLGQNSYYPVQEFNTMDRNSFGMSNGMGGKEGIGGGSRAAIRQPLRVGSFQNPGAGVDNGVRGGNAVSGNYDNYKFVRHL
jgi:hypothetical protein